MTKKKKQIKKELKKAKSPFFLAALLLLLFYPPYFRGLFFERELLPTQIITGIIFLSWIIYKFTVLQERKFFRDQADIAALALVGAYLISFFGAANYRYALGEFLKYTNYFIVYYLASDIIRDEKEKRIVLWILLLSAFGVALVGIGAAAGTVKYPGAFVGGRINSTLQYPNTLAAYITAALMLGLGLQAVTEKRWQKALLSAINYTLFLTFLFTLSRAAWLMFPIFYLILLAGIPGAYRKKVFGYSLQCFAVGILVSPGFGSGISGGQGGKVWLWYFIGLLLTPAVFYIFEKLGERFVVRISPKILLVVLITTVIVAGTGLYVAFNTEEPLYLSHEEGETESWKTSWYTVGNVKPDTEYVLQVTVTANPGEKEGWWGGAVLINSVDEKNKSQRIKNEYFNEPLENQSIEIRFRTPQDAVKLQIGFANRYPGTSAVFSSARIYDASDKAEGQRIILAYKYIPEAVAKRIESISFGEHSVQGRLSFYRDALKMIKERPLLGWGGGGWKAAYFAYQSYRYFTTEVHSFFLQLIVETGILGFAAFMTLMALIVKNFALKKFDDVESAAVNWSLLSSSLAILGHSAVDFNLSLSAVAIFLWTVFGLMVSGSATSPTAAKKKREVSGLYGAWAAGALAFILILGSGTLYAGYTYGQKAVEALQKGDIAKAKEYFEKASKYDPITASFKADLSQIYEIIGEQAKDDGYKEKAIKLKEEAVALDPYNAKMKTLLAAAYLKEGKLKEGLSLLEEAARLNPYNITVWETLAEAYEKSAEVYIAKGEKANAQELFKKCLAIPEKIVELNRESPKNDPGVEKLAATKNLMLYLAKAEKLMESPDVSTVKTLKDLIFAANFGLDLDENDIPDLWRFSGEGKLEVKQGEYTRIRPSGSSQLSLYTSGVFDLEEGESYEINVEAEAPIGSYKVEVIVDSKVISSSEREVLQLTAPGGTDGKEAGIRIVLKPEGEVVLRKVLVYKR